MLGAVRVVESGCVFYKAGRQGEDVAMSRTMACGPVSGHSQLE